MKYNELYSRPTTLQLGDLSELHFALAAVDDYLLWLIRVRGIELPGRAPEICSQISKARSLANKFMNEGLNREP